MTEGEHLINRGIVEFPTLGIEGAVKLQDSALNIVAGMSHIPGGFVALYSRTGMLETARATGAATPLNAELAMLKAKSVLATRRSNTTQKARMKQRGQTREDFGDTLGTLMGGGVALFADRELTQFVAVMVFSGGLPEEDDEICRQAAEQNGLFTDLPPVQKEEPVIN